MNWELLPRRGIRIAETKIVIGASRIEVRKALSGDFPPPINQRRPREDQYAHDDRKIILRYDANNNLKEILCINGELHLAGLELHDTTWSKSAPRLEALVDTITEPEYYTDERDCSELRINITTREDIGGDEGDDKIEWITVWRLNMSL